MTYSLRETPSPRAEPDWRAQLRQAVRDIAELERLLELPSGALAQDARVDPAFPLRVPRSFVARMRKGDPSDPLLLQILPRAVEQLTSTGFASDPLREHALAQQGCISKYPGRSLLITTAACPVHCRYCFRREFPYASQHAARDDWQSAVDTIRRRPGTREVILSGGDPLSLSNAKLATLLHKLEAIPDLLSLRIHTRYPIVLPARVDTGLIRLLESTRLAVVIVVHANHAQELDASVDAAIEALRGPANAILNQSVLLRDVNDDATTLIRLGRRLIEAGIVPYYLHLLDRVNGTAHFEVDEKKAMILIDEMRREAPGYLVPRLVRDVAGELSKTVIV